MKKKIVWAIATLLTVCSCAAPAEPSSSSINNITSEVRSEVSEELSSKPSVEKKEDTSSKKESSSSKKQSSSSSKKPSGSTSSKKTSANTSSKKTSNTETENYNTNYGWYPGTTSQSGYGWSVDTTKLTFTQADVGKIIGYDSRINQDIIVKRVYEDVNGTGQKFIHVSYSNGESISKVECQYCHGFPCPNGGGKKCSKYDIKLDGQITCQQCGKPNGNGYYGTCHGTIDWNNGAKITCHHYLNCLKCGKPVGDGYNGTCHVTWGKYSGVTTCHHYD